METLDRLIIDQPQERGPRHQDIVDHPERLQEWTNETLLNNFLDVRFIIMTETRVSSNIDRVSLAIQVGRLEHEEILRRMRDGYSEAPF